MRGSLLILALLAIGIADGQAAGDERTTLPSADAGAGTSTRARVLFKPELADFYPPESVRLQEEGNVTVKVCFDEAGKATQATVAESSGNPRLDAAAALFGLKIVIQPGKKDGVTVVECVAQRVTFALRSRPLVQQPSDFKAPPIRQRPR